MKGELHACDDDTVWITKTHPIAGDDVIPGINFSATKQIYLVRNPIDMIVSEFLLYTAASHSKSINEEIKGHPGFQKWVKIAAPRINVMQRNVMLKADEGVPTLFLTYEMLILELEKTLTDVFRFFLNVPSLEGTVLEKRIKDACAEGHAKKAVYGLKTTNQKDNLSRNLNCYMDEDLDVIKEELREFLHFYGYTNHPNENNATAFFEFDDQSEDNLMIFNKFRQLNKATLDRLGLQEPAKQYVFGPGYEGEQYELEDLAEVLNYSQTFTHRI